MLTESVLLAIIAGMLGVLLAFWGGRALAKMHPMALGLDLHPDVRVLAFTVAACLVTAILFGVAPASRSANVTPSPALRAATICFASNMSCEQGFST